MARDLGLEEQVRGNLRDIEGLHERPMFGGWAWLLNGNLLCGARDDGVLFRLGMGRDDWALAIDGIQPMISRGRPMPGWVRITPDTFVDDEVAQRVLNAALEFARTLPPK